MEVPKVISELVERFESNYEAYRSGRYNETQLRREFLDPLFVALGWDVSNKQGYAEAYKDVIHEDAIKIGGYNKAPDYCFRIGGTRKFFVEAKKPSVNLKDDSNPAYQLRRYAWSAKLPLSILTNFEGFAVYDCRIKPAPIDKASVARIMYVTYTEYLQHWNDVDSIFSRQAVLKGSFDRYVESSKGKKGTAEVDDTFLGEIESWRDLLTRHLALRNPDLTQRELNYAVQLTIDRIIFLRICEDRGIEGYGQLMALLNTEQIYERLCHMFQKADARYNSGLFHFRQEKGRNEPPDELTLRLALDDKPLREIIKSLYYPDSPYEFSVLSADILGQVYEQFLGKVIRLTPSHRAVIEYKPEVKKAGGIYYTPTYIVNYIVTNTVSKWLEGRTPKHAAELRIIDPACGSGSFLIEAYQHLLDWHRDWYIDNDPQKWAKGRQSRLYQSQGGDWRLTTNERKRILLNNIYGVDIDSQAVEVTKLSLLLKVLEGENEETLDRQLSMFQERALPDLSNNIKFGNSLVETDFYNNQQMSLLDEEERYHINVFDWEAEFPDIMKNGFDVVIGNPPYVSVESTTKDISEYYLKTFKSAYGRVNSFSLFLEKALTLLGDNGYCGFITSNRILTNTQLAPLRKLMLESSTIDSLLTFRKTVFKAAVDTAVLTFRKVSPHKDHRIQIWHDIFDLNRKDYQVNSIVQSTFLENPSHVFNVTQRENLRSIIQHIEKKAVKLAKLCDVKDGIILGGIKELFISNALSDKRYEKWLEGNEVSRYLIEWTGRYICYDYSLIEEELKRKKEKARLKATSSSDFMKISRPGIWLRNPEIFRQAKIITRQNAKRLIGVLDNEGYFVKNSLHCTILKDKSYSLKYILGLMNSRLLDLWFQDQIGRTGEVFSQMKIVYIEELPIRAIDFSDPSDRSRHDCMVELVDSTLSLHKELTVAKTNYEKTTLKRQIKAMEWRIDQLVYELYGLSKDETKVVKNST